jgi:MFS family permease
MYIPQILAGKLSDRIGRKILITIGLSLIVIALISINIKIQLVFAIIGMLIFYMGHGFVDPAYNNFVSENQKPTKAGSTFGLMYFAYFIGSVSATGLIDILGPSYSYPFYFRLALYVFIFEILGQNLLLNEKVLRQYHQENRMVQDHHIEKQLSRGEVQKIPIWKFLLQNKRILGIAIYLMLDSFIWGLSLSTYNAGLMANFGMTKEDIAFNILVFHIGNFLFQIPAGYIVDKIGEKLGFIYSVACGFFQFGLVIIAWFFRNNYYLIFIALAQVFFAISVTLFLPSQFSIITDFSSERRAEIYSIVNVIKGLGFIPTGVIGGFLMEQIHFLAPIIITLACLPIEIYFIYRLIPSKKKPIKIPV